MNIKNCNVQQPHTPHEWYAVDINEASYDNEKFVSVSCPGVFAPEPKVDATAALLDSRHATYGDRVMNMEAAAMMVNGYLMGVEVRSGKREINGADFAMIMALYKSYRFAVTPTYSDNINDFKGYANIAEECVGNDMIHAASAEEFQAEVKRRAANVPF